MVDDNAFNSFTSTVVSVDRTFSIREIFKHNPKLKGVLEMLTTTTVGTVLPDFPE